MPKTAAPKSEQELYDDIMVVTESISQKLGGISLLLRKQAKLVKQWKKQRETPPAA
jgi:ABC-type uncharacterized transport system permease subunit